tara:strand:- start:2798 stop:3277 length:480 start_codon:yes stop_codon:yes gene_type:complete
MSIEIERRFLIKNNQWKRLVLKKIDIVQSYLSSNSEGWITRIRSENKEFKLTLKKHLNKASNLEFEYEIPKEDGEIIISKVRKVIIKERFYLLVNKRAWIIDRFKGDNFPLEIAEIELNNEKETIDLPSFLSKEITHLKEYSNFELFNKPFSKWNNKIY